MQLYAYDQFDKLVFSRQAEKRIDYHCLECRGIVRLREGSVRQPHFYHLQRDISCRESRKGLAHINLQLHLERLLPPGEAKLEHRFKEIQRIADVAWLEKKLIFEIQCSPLSKEELQARMRDYQSLGLQVIWILHDARYNQWRVSQIERELAASPHYYSNMSSSGVGIIYDQWHFIDRGVRTAALPKLPVDLAAPYIKENHRFGLGFAGDIESLPEDHSYLVQIREKETLLKPAKRPWIAHLTRSKIKETFDALLLYLIKPYCKEGR